MKRSRLIKRRGVMTFHVVGCTGCHADQQATHQVAAAMAAQVAHPHRMGGTSAAVSASFFYHLGDVVYKHDKDTAGIQSPPPAKPCDFAELYNTQFYAPFATYPRAIFAVAGNHDGKNREPEGPPRKSGIHHFLKNFCGLEDGDPPDNHSSDRPAMKQPYPYWLLVTPLAYCVGLYTNVNNGGQLDNPEDYERRQYDWLARTLKDIKDKANGKAVFLMLHYPPYSAAVNFLQAAATRTSVPPRGRRAKLWNHWGCCCNRHSGPAGSTRMPFFQPTPTPISDSPTRTPTDGKSPT